MQVIATGNIGERVLKNICRFILPGHLKIKAQLKCGWPAVGWYWEVNVGISTYIILHLDHADSDVLFATWTPRRKCKRQHMKNLATPCGKINHVNSFSSLPSFAGWETLPVVHSRNNEVALFWSQGAHRACPLVKGGPGSFWFEQFQDVTHFLFEANLLCGCFKLGKLVILNNKHS